MKIWFISDTHNQHERLEIPDNLDIVVHCGDESNSGYPTLNEPEAHSFFEWYTKINVPLKIFVPGNHSTAVEQGLITPKDYPGVVFLVHRELRHEGLLFFGSPYTPEFADWSYMKPRRELGAIWKTIPENVDVLITHGPPKGTFDLTKDWDTGVAIHVGSKSLARHVEERIRPKIHSFGHIHDERGIRNFGMTCQNGIQFINCSCCDNLGRLINNGFVVDVATPDNDYGLR